jgi:hypothetical protein
VTKRGQLCCWPNRAGNKTWLFRRGIGIRHLASQSGCPFIDRKSLILESVFGQHNGGGSKRVGFDHIASRLQKLAMHSLHGVRPGEHELLVAPFQGGPTEILGGQVEKLQRGAGGSVKNQHGLFRTVQPLQKADALGWLCR